MLGKLDSDLLWAVQIDIRTSNQVVVQALDEVHLL